MEFPRYTLSVDVPGDLYLFCDASKAAYGFAAYMVQDGKSHLIFSKVKVAPLQSRTLPVLELLPIFLALVLMHRMCLPGYCRNFCRQKAFILKTE